MKRARTTFVSSAVASVFGVVAACGSSNAAHPTASTTPPPDAATLDGDVVAVVDGADDGPSVPPFQADPPSVYVAKVKDVLVGLAPTDAEVQAVTSDPTQLGALIDGWMATPQYQQKMLTFFELAFQQTQISVTDFADQAYPSQIDVNGTTTPLLVQNAKESFARTVLELIAEGSPLTDAMTTTRLMMTPALMELYAFLDAYQVDDQSKLTDRFKAANPSVIISAEAAQGPIAITDTLNPSSPNYMVWYDPDVANAATLTGTGCGQDPIPYPSSALSLQYLLYGSLRARKNPAGGACGQYGGTAAAPQITGTDFTDWKMVTLRPPASGESPTAFYDLPTLRSTTTLVLGLPRVGFFTTPAFFANWQTNTSNQMRVTMNQALIVATGAQVDGTDPTLPPSTPGLDTAHASQPACLACHQTLDPTRSLLASQFSWDYHQQTEAAFAQQPGLFVFQGVVQPVSTVADLGNVFASHPLFAQAWVEKLCYYVNSSACEPSDPEFQRVVSVFKSSGYSWSALVHELLSSPLTTNAAPTQTTTDTGEIIAVKRRDHLCAALDNRLGLTDVCALDANTKAKGIIPEVVSGLPSDGYGRGAVAPVLPNQPTLFYRAGLENICESVAAMVIDVAAAQPDAGGAVDAGGAAGAGAVQWSSKQPDAAIADFVHVVMGLAPSDARASQAQSILSSHYQSALGTGASATSALRSTFVAACLSPSAASIGL